jgi:TolB-like protein
MTRSTRWAAVGSAALLASVAGVRGALAQEGAARFVVLPFENTGSYGQDKEVFAALELGLPALLGRALDRHPTADVVPPAQVTAAMRAKKLGPAQRVDAASAAQLGKEAGARYTVTGSFADFYGKFRINARVVDTGSGEIVKVVSNDDPKLQDRAQLAAIVQAVAERIASAAGLGPYPSGTAAAPIPTDALTAYSRGLLHEWQGDRAGASKSFENAIKAYPRFDEAREGLARVRGQ